MKQLFITALLLYSGWPAAQNVGIGTSSPSEKLHVSGAIRLESSSNAASAPGTIRWNAASHDFEGFNGTRWVSLTGGKSSWGSQNSYSFENGAFNQNLFAEFGAELGRALAISGNQLLVGAPRETAGNHFNAGGAFFTYRSGDRWYVSNNLYAPQHAPGDYYGQSLALSSGYALIGAPGTDVEGRNEQGKAWLYRVEDKHLELVTGFTASDGAATDYFGSAVALSGNLALVGAPSKDVGPVPFQNKSQGAVYGYRKVGSLWLSLPRITAPDGAEGDRFGTSLSLHGNWAAIGAPYKEVNGHSAQGRVYLYQYNGNSFVQGAVLDDPENDTGNEFGYSLHLENDTLLVGVPELSYPEYPGNGKVYVYVRNGAAWQLTDTLKATGGQRDAAFGSSVHRSGDQIIVGAPGMQIGSAQGQGAAYIFQRRGSRWEQQAALMARTGDRADGFGTSVALSGGAAAVGAVRADIMHQKENGNIYYFFQ
ncbi:MAG TPA: hypothetical protein VHK69_21205 [Chitinophagaceae bacterium]|jgi:hypothetical protein|nr:hypothetical protein [Chitinophagaceae bacterium]